MAQQRVGTDLLGEQFSSGRDSPEIFKGENTGICSHDDFWTLMSAPGTWLRFRSYAQQPKVFWFETEEGEQVRTNFDSWKSLPILPGQSTIIQDGITGSALIYGQFCWSSKSLFQFWTPLKTKTGETKLTVSGQPFVLGNLYEGLCRYKYHCMQQEHEDEYGQNGPPARVFKRGLREDCENIKHYFTEEFPTRDYAIDCGIVGYWAFPLFESGATQQCLGVLECFSMDEYDYGSHMDAVRNMAMEFGLEFCSPHYHKCDEICRDIVCSRDEVEEALEVVMETHQLPLIQVWVPCMCGGSSQTSFAKASNKLFCDMGVSENFNFTPFVDGSFVVKSGEGLVGSAYSENRPCFFSDTSRLSMSNSPFAHLARFAGLTACFVIPLKLVHPLLDDLFLEMFLPPQGTCTNEGSEAVLKSLMSSVAQEFSKGLNQDEEFLAEFSHFGGENLSFSFFHVKRITKGGAKNSCSIESLPNEEDTAGSSGEITAEEPVHLDLQNAQATAAEQVNLDELKKYPNASDSSGEVIATLAEDQITMDVLKPYFGNIIDAASKELGVSRSTLKRRCRALGIKRWPWHKRNKVTHTQSNPRLKQSQTQKKAPHSHFQTESNAAASEREAAADSVPSSSDGDRFRQSHGMIGKATYGDDTVMFPLKSHSGIEELHKELNQRFQLQADKFKIKYKYEEDWILIICDQDLHLGLDMIKSTGKNTINLSILPLPTS